MQAIAAAADAHKAAEAAGGGYLCRDLDLFITHEPCVMCAWPGWSTSVLLLLG